MRTGADVGLHPASTWNNPEPEIVLVIDSRARIVGATLGNDVNSSTLRWAQRTRLGFSGWAR